VLEQCLEPVQRTRMPWSPSALHVDSLLNVLETLDVFTTASGVSMQVEEHCGHVPFIELERYVIRVLLCCPRAKTARDT
jgi:hypothetical protein